MKVVSTAIILALLSAGLYSQRPERLPRFEQYKSKVYPGRIKYPKWMSFENGSARDELGKLTDTARINFAGKYFISAHSCGTECRYYSLTDLSNGRDSHLLSVFDASDATPRQNIPILFSQRNSNLLIVQYEPKFGSGLKCREQSYVFHHGKLKPVTRLVKSCRLLG